MKSKLSTFAALTFSALFVTISPAAATPIESRTVEFPFKVSADLRSEFRAKPPVVCAGLIIAEARWTQVRAAGSAELQPRPLSLILFRPDGTEAARRAGTSPLRLEYRAAEAEVEGSSAAGGSAWAVKLVNDADGDRAEVEGRLRVTVPLSATVLVEAQFTLLASGNAQEMAFTVARPGRLVMEAGWRTDSLSGTRAEQTPLALLLIHPGQDKTYARRQGPSPLRVERQITEGEIDKGLRWIARIQNDGGTKVKGLLKVIFTPAL
jgi:hypothetical protein